MMIRFSVRLLKSTLKAATYSLLGGIVMLIAIYVWHMNNQPDLHIWHTADLDAEFSTAFGRKAADSFTEYLAMEDKLFKQLDQLIYAKTQAEPQSLINRFHRGSLSDPERWKPNWNRSFEMPAENPQAGILLLHGLSDSPYSLRDLGQKLNQAGAWVLGLRIPGHGTAPSGLVEVRWQDMAAAVRLAMQHLDNKLAGKPLYIIGYSNGGALAVEYALARLQDDTLPAVSRLVLISPAIGVTAVATFAVWQARLGHLLGLEKLSWTSIQPEYDPFKYNSFAVNAGDLAHRITSEIQSGLRSLSGTGELKDFPPVLAFQSVVDATVSVPAVVENLFEKLPENNHELVLFDINRLADMELLMRRNPRNAVSALMHDVDLSFTISLVGNENDTSEQVIVRRKTPGETDISKQSLDLQWPRDVYSLTHVALPFPIDDPLYGDSDDTSSPGIRLGHFAMRGERGVLQISAADMLRLRWNPFHPYMEHRLLEFIDLPRPAGVE